MKRTMKPKRQALTKWILPIAMGLLLAGVATAQTIVRSFDGDHGPGLAACESGITHCDIPEMAVAVNGTQVVQVTWQNVRIYDYSGRLRQSVPMSELVRKARLDPVPPSPNSPNPALGQGPYEPHIVYDEFIGRWIVTVTGLNDITLVSAGSDAMGSWGGAYVSCQQGGPCLNRDPALHIGYDRNGVYVCGEHTGDDSPRTTPHYSYDCFAVPAAEVEAIAQGKPPAHINRAHNMPLDVMPAIDHNPSKPASAPAFFAAKTCDRVVPGACQNSMNYPFEWLVDTFVWSGGTGTWNAGGSEQSVRTDVGSAQNKWLYSKPCCGALGAMPQAGNDTIVLRGVESHRLTNLVQFRDHIEGVLTSGPCTSGCGPQGADTTNLMFWVDLDCSKASACVVSQTAKISGPDFNPAFATVGVDAGGNVGIVAVSSSAGTDLSVLLWTRRKSDPPGTFKGPTMIVAGTQPYTCRNIRNMATIGNAAGVLTALDPVDGTKLWTTQQWANDAARCVWNTRIVEYQIDLSPAK